MLARFEAAHGETDAAVALLDAFIDRANRELPPSHYAIGELQLVLAETLASTQKTQALAELDAADAAFGELPQDHPWRKRSAALRKRLATR